MTQIQGTNAQCSRYHASELEHYCEASEKEIFANCLANQVISLDLRVHRVGNCPPGLQSLSFADIVGFLYSDYVFCNCFYLINGFCRAPIKK